MAVLVQIREAFKSYGDQVLLQDAEVNLSDDVKVGFVGRNGAGKSTLLRVILGEEELDSGVVMLHPTLRVGYLRQHDPFQPGESALDFLMRDSGQPDWKCGEVAGQFELKGAYLEGPVAELSGGWQTRVKLAALLLHEPNLLLLDEPTNFLDLRTQLLLENFLRAFPQGCLIVSHDRTFLEATCTHTLELARGRLTMHPGSIDAYLIHREERRQHELRVNATVAAKQKQLQKFIDTYRAKARSATQAKSKNKQLERLQLIEIDSAEATAHIRAPDVQPRQGAVLRCENLSIGYTDLEVASGIGLEIEHGERVAIVGDNGQGKTTLLRTLVDSLPALSGNKKWGHASVIGTYAQHVYRALPEGRTVLEQLEYEAKPGTTFQEIMAIAGALLFREDHVKKKIKVLSGGERARLCLAGLLLGDYNILVLDEPGNHLDVETVEALANALLAYRGTVLFTAHDRHFMGRIATTVIEVREGRVRNYGGGYEAYLYSVKQAVASGERTATGKSKISNHRHKKKDVLSATQVPNGRKLKKQIANLERKIARCDDEKRGLEKELLTSSDPTEALRLHKAITVIDEELSVAEGRWMELQEQLGET